MIELYRIRCRTVFYRACVPVPDSMLNSPFHVEFTISDSVADRFVILALLK
jgi:hypothetical protein